MNKNSIKVLHIASGDLWAGAEVQLFTLARSLARLPNVQVVIVLLNHGTLEQKLIDNGIDVIVLDETRLNGIRILLRLIGVIRKNRPDVVHTHRMKENILGSIAALINNTPSIRTTHGASEHKLTWNQLPKQLIRFVSQFCGRYLQKYIVTVSDDLAGKLKQYYPASKIKVIENGLDLEPFTSNAGVSETDTDTSVSETTTSSTRIGIAGRLVPVKRVDLFIQAAAELSRTYPELDISFHIFGDGPLQNTLLKLSNDLGTKDMIYFEGHCENMRQALADMDILLITSDHEGLPMILLEAMASRTAVIAHATGGIPNVLNQGECGILVSEHKPEAYAHAIYQLIKDPEKRSNYIDRAFEQVTRRYSSETNAINYLSIYKQLIR